MDKREAAGVLAQCKWLKEQIKRWEDAAKMVLSHELEPGERAACIAPDGVQLGFAAMVAGRREVEVDNEEAFTAWVADRWPTEITRAVRPKFRKQLEDKAKQLGSLPDEIDGTLCPYVTVVRYDSFPKVTLSEWADAVLAQRFRHKLLMDVITPPSEQLESLSGAYRSDAPAGQQLTPEQLAAQGLLPGEEYLLSENPTAEPEPDLDPEPGTWDESSTFEDSDAVRQRRGPQ